MSKAVILQAISGAGKSTYCKELTASWTKGQTFIASADYGMMTPEGLYEFKPEKLGPAHKLSMISFILFLQRSGNNLVIVDNTNTTMTDLIPYYRVAEAFDADPEIHHIPCDINVAIARNLHGTPEGTIKRMAENIEYFIAKHSKRFNFKVIERNK